MIKCPKCGSRKYSKIETNFYQCDAEDCFECFEEECEAQQSNKDGGYENG